MMGKVWKHRVRKFKVLFKSDIENGKIEAISNVMAETKIKAISIAREQLKCTGLRLYDVVEMSNKRYIRRSR